MCSPCQVRTGLALSHRASGLAPLSEGGIEEGIQGVCGGGGGYRDYTETVVME